MIALTDHDTTDGLAEAQAAGATHGVTVIPGIEINTYLPRGQGEAHVLGYYLDTAILTFRRFCSFLRDARERRGERMVALLREQGSTSPGSGCANCARLRGPPACRAGADRKGYANSVSDAFETLSQSGAARLRAALQAGARGCRAHAAERARGSCAGASHAPLRPGRRGAATADGGGTARPRMLLWRLRRADGGAFAGAGRAAWAGRHRRQRLSRPQYAPDAAGGPLRAS